MALRDSKLFRLLGYTMFGLVIASFVLGVVLRIESGHGADFYHGGRGLPIPNIAALVTIGGVAFVVFIWLCQLAWHKWRKWRHPIARDN